MVITGPNIISILPWEYRAMIPIQQRFRHSRRVYTGLIKWPITGNHYLFHVLWNERWEGAGIWLWASADGNFCARHVSCEACCLVRMGVGRSNSRHEAGSPFNAITKVSRILDASTVLMTGVNKCVIEAHHHDPILEASQEHLGDQVMLKMVSSWKHRSLSPKRSKHIIQTRAFIVVRDRIGIVRASNTTRMFMILSVKSLSRAQPVAENAKNANSEPRTRSTRYNFHVDRMSATR